jgi:hypothetical protein
MFMADPFAQCKCLFKIFATILIFALIIALHWQPTMGCVPRCSHDSDCLKYLRCGPQGFCILRCFVGETDSCQPGFICNNDGSGCIPLSESPPTDGSNSPDDRSPDGSNSPDDQPPNDLN